MKICSSFGSIFPSHYVQIAGIGKTSKKSRHIFQRNKNPFTKWIWWFNTYSTGRGDLLQILKNLKPSTLWLMLDIGKEKCQRHKCCGIWRKVSQSGHVSMWLNPMIFYHRDTKSLEQNILKIKKLTPKPMLMTGIDQLPNSLVMSVNQKSKMTHNML